MNKNVFSLLETFISDSQFELVYYVDYDIKKVRLKSNYPQYILEGEVVKQNAYTPLSLYDLQNVLRSKTDLLFVLCDNNDQSNCLGWYMRNGSEREKNDFIFWKNGEHQLQVFSKTKSRIKFNTFFTPLNSCILFKMGNVLICVSDCCAFKNFVVTKYSSDMKLNENYDIKNEHDGNMQQCQFLIKNDEMGLFIDHSFKIIPIINFTNEEDQLKSRHSVEYSKLFVIQLK